jgi:CubicO group peptidase (beta-lactamase class C family)
MKSLARFDQSARRQRQTPAILVVIAVAAIGIGALQWGPKYQQATLARSLTAFHEYLSGKLAEGQIVGASVMVVRNSDDPRIVFQDFLGKANLEKNQPVDEDTIYHWASITKTFTGIAIMQLRDRGLLKLDDPVIKYIPELRDIHDTFGDRTEITIRQLMTHSAGFRGATWPWGGDQPWHPFEPRQWSQIVAMLPYTNIEFKPGSRYSYSNLGIVFLGRIIELLTGDDFEVYIDKNIFKPLEMHRSYFDTTPYHLLPHRSASYWIRDGKRQAAIFDADTGITVSNGGLNAPLPDMVKYLTFLLGDESKKSVYNGVLNRTSLEEMWRPQIDIGDDGSDHVAMGLIFFVERREGMQLIGHSGGQNGFISHFYISPGRGIGYLIAFNTDWAVAENKKDPTREADSAIRSYIVRNVFPAFLGK